MQKVISMTNLAAVKKKKLVPSTKILEIPELNMLVGLPTEEEQIPLKFRRDLIEKKLQDIEEGEEKESLIKDAEALDEQIGTAVVHLKQLDFDSYITLTTAASDRSKKMIEDIASAASYDGDIEGEAKYVLRQMSADSQYRLNVVKEGVTEPKLNDQLLVTLSNYFPMTVTKIYTEVMLLTQQGADLKKNSTG